MKIWRQLIPLLVLLATFGLSLFLFKSHRDFFGIIPLGKEAVSQCFLPNTYSLCVTERGKAPLIKCLNSKALFQRKKYDLKISPLRFSILKVLPNARKRWDPKSKKRIELFSGGAKEFFPSSQLDFQPLGPLRFAAQKTKDLAETLLQLSASPQEKVVAFLEDESQKAYLFTCFDGVTQLSSVEALLKDPAAVIEEQKTWVPIGSQGRLAIPTLNQVLDPSKVPEENTPSLYLLAEGGNVQEETMLYYDPFASGPMWSLLQGKYFVRFQPLVQQLPVQVENPVWSCAHASHEQHTEACELTLEFRDKSGKKESHAFKQETRLKRGKYSFFLLDRAFGKKGDFLAVKHSDRALLMLSFASALLGIGLLSFFLKKKRLQILSAKR